jgi:hypothetical protein
MTTKTDRRATSRTSTPREGPSQQAVEALPTWRNTRPRGNPEPDKRDLQRSRERFEALLGR